MELNASHCVTGLVAIGTGIDDSVRGGAVTRTPVNFPHGLQRRVQQWLHGLALTQTASTLMIRLNESHVVQPDL
eukprot:1555395-Pleurochrysis_carterae.AAC.1